MKKEYIYGGLAIIGVIAVIALARRRSAPVLKSSGGDWLKPVEGRLTSGFGVRKDPLNPAKEQGHNGQDIAVPIGTPTKAANDGLVTSTTGSEAGGNQVIIKHDNGYTTGYAHLKEIKVNKGQRVRKGQIIALSGNTGKHTTGPHLHLTLTDPKGVKVDPKPRIYIVKAA